MILMERYEKFFRDSQKMFETFQKKKRNMYVKINKNNIIFLS
jgi:hypothetical protein